MTAWLHGIGAHVRSRFKPDGLSHGRAMRACSFWGWLAGQVKGRFSLGSILLGVGVLALILFAPMFAPSLRGDRRMILANSTPPTPSGRLRRDIVLVFASGPLWEEPGGGRALSRFAGSLRGVNELVDIVLLVELSRAATAPLDVAARHRVSVHFFHGSPGEADVPPSLLRWRVFSTFLETHAALYEGGWVLVADAADVAFQSDPFGLADAAAASTSRAQLLAFLADGGTVIDGDSEPRQAAVLRCYPSLNQGILGAPVVTAIVLGTFAASLELAHAMTAAIASLPSNGGVHCEGDAPVLNRVLRESDRARSLPEVEFFSHEHGPVQSIRRSAGEEDVLLINPGGQFASASSGEVPVAVYHLDSSRAVTEVFERRFPVPHQPSGLEPIGQIVSDIWSTFLKTPLRSRNQQTLRNYVEFAVSVRAEAVARGGCQLLVFGLGHDSPFIARANAVPGSVTVFVESSAEWLHDVQLLLPPSSGARALLYTYNRTRVADTDAILALPPSELHARLWMNELPPYVTSNAWDVVLVDAPPGYASYLPGRLQPLYTASVLARKSLPGGAEEEGHVSLRDRLPRHVYVHDCGRETEAAGVAAFFAGVPSVVDAQLLHLVLPAPPGAEANGGE